MACDILRSLMRTLGRCSNSRGPREPILPSNAMIHLLLLSNGVETSWPPSMFRRVTGRVTRSRPLEIPSNQLDVSVSAAKINGQAWDPNVGLGSIEWNQVHEWTISGSGAHPFHLRIHHMMIVTPGGCGPLHVEGAFYDTLSASGSCQVRFKTADFGQRMVMVCCGSHWSFSSGDNS
jgi:FtsP/CotA-like multicopper oxidase with cupredoxin domain